MKITELSIKKPIAMTMVVMFFILLGIMGYINLGADLFPRVNIPVIFITSIYPGAGAQEVEKDVVKPIEDAVAGISGVDRVNATASEGVAQIVIEFKLSANPTDAMIDTQKALDGISDKLPKDATRPQLFKFDQNAEPIIVMTLSGDKSSEELNNKADFIKERLERVQGVGNVSVFGGSEKELQIKLDKQKLESYGISINQIVQRLQMDNLNFPGGVINQPHQDKVVRIEGEFEDLNEISEFKIPVGQGYVRLGDIASISLEYPKAKELARENKKEAVGIIIQKQSDANIVKTSDLVKKELTKLNQSLKGYNLKLVQDSTVFIKSSLNETKRNLIEGVITTGIVLFLFLRQWRSVLIAMIAIPTSLISTFFMMYVMGFTFNILSLMGLALCVGILVDDSVVVIENIYRHLKMGKEPKQAALDGRNEIGMAAIAITLSDVVVFAPIAFMSGMVGQYFRQFGLVVVCATLFSLFVSFTLTPMLASRMLKEHDEESEKGKIFSKFNKFENYASHLYERLLLWALRHRIKLILVVLGLLVVSVSFILTGVIGTEFMPYTEQGEFTINAELSPGSTLYNSNEKAKILEQYVKTIPEMDYYFVQVGSDGSANKISLYVKLLDKTKRHKSQKRLVEDTRKWVTKNMVGVSATVQEPSMAGEGGKPIRINVSGSKLEVLEDITKKVEEIVKHTPGTIEVANSQQNGKPAYSVKVNKLASGTYGITALDVSNTVRSSIEGTKAGVYRNDDQNYDIKVRMKDDSIKDMNDINSLYVSNNMGKTATVGDIAQVNLSQSPTFIKRVNKQRVITVSANLKEGYTLGEVSGKMLKEINELKLPDGYSASMTGQQEDMQDTFKSLVQVLILSILLVYMILVILYESFLTPFVRILALPVGAIGSLTLLAITGNTLNMLSMIGLIMLDGLAAKNGTLLIDYTNTLMNRGYELRDALVEAGKTRLKPIFMTSFTMIVGMLPTALALGDGAEFKSSMAIVIIGGMLTSTILSPIVLPVAYTLIDDFKKFFKNKFTNKQHTNSIGSEV